MSTVREVFDRTARDFDRARRQLVPCFDDLYATALEQLRAERDAELSILDLGAGTGLLSLFVSERFPRAELVLVDVSPEMLEVARERFSPRSERFRFVASDFSAELPDGPFDFVVSALAIHHLEHAAKRRLFRGIHARLRPGGSFVNADQVLGPTPELEARYRGAWRSRVEALGVEPGDLAAALERMREDRAAPVGDQLGWLREAGFTQVDCWYKSYGFAVFGGEATGGRG
jgi:tRNA (cmo5U34)-methyltransferase